jgi:anaphase-promoting complex subunit 4
MSSSESIISNTNIENTPSPRHDILEVNNYLMSGLLVSSIDKWFMGPVPRFSPRDLGVPGDNQDLHMLLKRAKTVVDDPAQTAWQLVGPFINGKCSYHRR